MDEDTLLDEDLLEMKAMLGVNVTIENFPLADFWCSQLESYPYLTHFALQNVLPFATTYLCEAGFSVLVLIKTNARNRLGDVDHDMRLALSITVLE